MGWYLWTGQAKQTARPILPDRLDAVGEVPAQLAGEAHAAVSGVSQQDVGDVPWRVTDDHRALRESTEVNGRSSSPIYKGNNVFFQNMWRPTDGDADAQIRERGEEDGPQGAFRDGRCWILVHLKTDSYGWHFTIRVHSLPVILNVFKAYINS